MPRCGAAASLPLRVVAGTFKLGNNIALAGDVPLAFFKVAFGLREVLSQYHGVHGVA
jgi:hypothetical protein